MKMLVISSSPQTAEIAVLSARLRWPDFTPLVATNIRAGLDMVQQESPDLILLRPDFSNTTLPETLHRLRFLSTTPLLVLSQQGDEIEAVTALELGADDYVRLPCDTSELMVRICALLRRVSRTYYQNEGHLSSGPLLIDPATHEVFLEGHRVMLTSTEFRLLSVLVRNRGTIVPHRLLEQALWEGQSSTPGLVKKHVQRLRRKLGDNAREPRWVASVHGVGYRFVGPGPEPTRPLFAATA